MGRASADADTRRAGLHYITLFMHGCVPPGAAVSLREPEKCSGACACAAAGPPGVAHVRRTGWAWFPWSHLVARVRRSAAPAPDGAPPSIAAAGGGGTTTSLGDGFDAITRAAARAGPAAPPSSLLSQDSVTLALDLDGGDKTDLGTQESVLAAAAAVDAAERAPQAMASLTAMDITAVDGQAPGGALGHVVQAAGSGEGMDDARLFLPLQNFIDAGMSPFDV